MSIEKVAALLDVAMKRIEIEYVLFQSEKDNKPWPQKTTLDKLFGKHLITENKYGVPAFSPVTYKQGSTRSKENIERVNFFVFDIDGGKSGVARSRINELEKRLSLFKWLYYTSYSSKGGDELKIRVVILFDRSYDAKSHSHFIKEAVTLFGLEDRDTSCDDIAKIYFVPCSRPEYENVAEIKWYDNPKLLNPHRLALLDNGRRLGVWDRMQRAWENGEVENNKAALVELKEYLLTQCEEPETIRDVAYEKFPEEIMDKFIYGGATEEVDKKELAKKASSWAWIAGQLKTCEFKHDIRTYETTYVNPARGIRENWTAGSDCEMLCHIENTTKVTVQEAKFNMAIKSIIANSKFDPVKELFDSLIWDKKERISELNERCKFEFVEDIQKGFVHKALLGGVQRVYEPGCSFELMLCLTGEQGLGKTSFCKIMGYEDRGWYGSALNSFSNDKDELMKITAPFLIEAGEVDRHKGRGASGDFKNFMSTQVDFFRMPYAKSPESFPRRCFFIGTTNHTELLTDPTGDRRHLILRMSSQLDIDWLQENRDQLWAEMIHSYKQGNRPWYPPHVAKQIMELNAREFTTQNDMIDLLEEMVEELPERLTATELYELAFKNKVGVTPNEKYQLKQALMHIGYRYGSFKKDKKPVKGYIKK